MGDGSREQQQQQQARPPRMIVGPRDQEVIVGGTVLLECAATPDGRSPMPLIRWTRKGETTMEEEGEEERVYTPVLCCCRRIFLCLYIATSVDPDLCCRRRQPLVRRLVIVGPDLVRLFSGECSRRRPLSPPSFH